MVLAQGYKFHHSAIIHDALPNASVNQCAEIVILGLRYMSNQDLMDKKLTGKSPRKTSYVLTT